MNNQAFVKAARKNLAKENFKVNWLSDPSTYPIIVVMSGALFLVTG